MKVRHKKRSAKGSGLCGIWKDERSAAEIIKDIRCAGRDSAVERWHEVVKVVSLAGGGYESR